MECSGESNWSIQVTFPKIETQRLILNSLEPQDAAEIYTLFSDARVIEFYDFDVFTDTFQADNFIRKMEKRFQSGAGIRWGIKLVGSEKLVGTCGFNSWDSKMKSAVLGYDLLPEHWEKGIGTEAVRAIIDLALNGALACGDLNRIQADTIPGNVGSELVLKKIGFKEEGLRRECGFWKNKFHDLKCFGLIKRDYKILNQ